MTSACRDVTTHLIELPVLPSPLFFCFLHSQPHRSSDSGCSTREITDQTAAVTLSSEAKGKCHTNTACNTLQLVITTAFILIKVYISYWWTKCHRPTLVQTWGRGGGRFSHQSHRCRVRTNYILLFTAEVHIKGIHWFALNQLGLLSCAMMEGQDLWDPLTSGGWWKVRISGTYWPVGDDGAGPSADKTAMFAHHSSYWPKEPQHCSPSQIFKQGTWVKRIKWLRVEARHLPSPKLSPPTSTLRMVCFLSSITVAWNNKQRTLR